MSNLHVFSSHLTKQTQFCFAALLVGTILLQPLRAQISFGSATHLIDNVAKYVNHSNNTIYVDFGLHSSPQSTRIVVYAGDVTDVGAAVLNGQVLFSYIAPNLSLVMTMLDGWQGLES